MTQAEAIRQHLVDLKGWIEHWQTDRLCNLVPTEMSLIFAKCHADNALMLLDRMEGKQESSS